MTDDLTGRTLGPFHVEGKLGRGGMGAVYVATHKSNGKRVAIKVMNEAVGEQARKLAARFEKEIEFMAMFRHPNIVRFYGASEDHGIRFYAMELVEGSPLDQVLKHQPILPLARAVQYAVQICEALQEMHSTGIVHRDLKPSNVLVTSDQKIKLTDFGIARDTGALGQVRLTQAGHTVGSLPYMSPEQLAGQELTRKSDLYTLGVLIYEMLTGRHPFDEKDTFKVLQLRQTNTYPAPTMINPDLPLEIDGLIAELMAQDPEERPRDAYVVMQRLLDLEKRTREGTAPRVRPRQPSPSADTVDMKQGGLSTLLATVFGTRERKVKGSSSKRDSEAKSPTRWLESPVVLGLGIVALAGFLTYMLWPASFAERMRAARKVMQKPDVTLDEMVRLDNDLFQPILESDPNSPFAGEITGFRDQMAVVRARGKAHRAVATNRIDPDATEAERKFVNALRLKTLGDVATAQDQFVAITRVFASDADAKPWVTLANEQLDKVIEYSSDQERIESKRQHVAAKIAEVERLRKGGDLKEALNLLTDIESLYRQESEVADLIAEEQRHLLPAEELLRRGQRLLESDDPQDWKRAFDDYLNPLLAAGVPEPTVRRIEEMKQLRATKEAGHQVSIDLKAGPRPDAPEAERSYLTSRYVRDVLGDEVNADEYLIRLVGQYADDKSAQTWVELAQKDLEKRRTFDNRVELRKEMRASARKALVQFRERLQQDPSQEAWRPLVLSLYLDDGETSEIPAEEGFSPK